MRVSWTDGLLSLAIDACVEAVADAGLTLADIDGLSTYPGAGGMGMSEGGVTAIEEALRIHPTFINGGGDLPGPGGSVAHAELRIGDSVVFVSDEFPGMSAAPTLGATPSVYLFLYTEDVDATVNKAVSAGATVSMPVADMFWGDRYGKVTDPFGHSWGVATHVEDVAPDEMARRAAEWQANMAKSMAAGAGQS